MNQESLHSFNKISSEMEKLSQLMTKEEKFKLELQTVLQRASSQGSDESGVQNIDLFLGQYDNPTTKSIAFDEDIEANSRILGAQSSASNTIYRNYQNQQSYEGDHYNDNSTVIMFGMNKSGKGAQKNVQEEIPSATSSIPNYRSLNQDKVLKKEAHGIKKKKVISKNASESTPPEYYKSVEHHQPHNHSNKTGSMAKNHKMESPIMSHGRQKRGNAQLEQNEGNMLKDIKGKLAKFGKIDREQLHKLQEKKQFKKTELSSNRKKTKRGLGTVKSTLNFMSYTKINSSSTKFPSKKGYGNTSCKKFDSSKKDQPKKEEKMMPNHQDWQRMEKTHKKLNRVNICKLQQNMKKANEKKGAREASANRCQKRGKKAGNIQSHNEENQLHLHFTESNTDSVMKKLIDEKQLTREYIRQTESYTDAASKMSGQYFQKLMKECRQPSEQAILKLKLVKIILYFFDQFTEASLLSNQKFNPRTDDFFSDVAEQDIISVLLHPKKIIKLIQTMPSMLMEDNILSAERISFFMIKFGQINDQLDQQLQFFLIKKEVIYHYIHSLSQYITYLIQKDLVAQTKRAKIVPLSSKEPLYGFYSSRSKKEDGSNKYIRKNESGNKIGFRCDSDRRITVQEEDFCKETPKIVHKQSAGKSGQIKKLFK